MVKEVNVYQFVLLQEFSVDSDIGILIISINLYQFITSILDIIKADLLHNFDSKSVFTFVEKNIGHLLSIYRVGKG